VGSDRLTGRCTCLSSLAFFHIFAVRHCCPPMELVKAMLWRRTECPSLILSFARLRKYFFNSMHKDMLPITKPSPCDNVELIAKATKAHHHRRGTQIS
jgi:hypothetical protein